MPNKFNYTTYIYIIEDPYNPTPPQELITLLETGWEILMGAPYGKELRAIYIVLRKVI